MAVFIRKQLVLNVLEEEKGDYTAETVWNALQASAQDPNPKDITSNTQWSVDYNNTDLTAEIALRRHWEEKTVFSIQDWLQ